MAARHDGRARDGARDGSTNKRMPVCLDYLKGICHHKRWKCKYAHPPTANGMLANQHDLEAKAQGRNVCEVWLLTGFCKFGDACRDYHPPLEGLATPCAPTVTARMSDEYKESLEDPEATKDVKGQLQMQQPPVPPQQQPQPGARPNATNRQTNRTRQSRPDRERGEYEGGPNGYYFDQGQEYPGMGDYQNWNPSPDFLPPEAQQVLAVVSDFAACHGFQGMMPALRALLSTYQLHQSAAAAAASAAANGGPPHGHPYNGGPNYNNSPFMIPPDSDMNRSLQDLGFPMQHPGGMMMHQPPPGFGPPPGVRGGYPNGNGAAAHGHAGHGHGGGPWGGPMGMPHGHDAHERAADDHHGSNGAHAANGHHANGHANGNGMPNGNGMHHHHPQHPQQQQQNGAAPPAVSGTASAPAGSGSGSGEKEAAANGSSSGAKASSAPGTPLLPPGTSPSLDPINGSVTTLFPKMPPAASSGTNSSTGSAPVSPRKPVLGLGPMAGGEAAVPAGKDRSGEKPTGKAAAPTGKVSSPIKQENGSARRL